MSEKNECTPCRLYPSDSDRCDSCGCVGYAYVPVQELCSTYDDDMALMRGTLFPTLDLSICEYGYVCKEKGGCLDG